MSEQVIPWNIVGGAGVAKISTSNFPWERAHMQLVLLGAATSAYAWIGRELASAEAAAEIATANPTWDIAVSNLFASPVLHWDVATAAFITVFAGAAANGFVYFSECYCAEKRRELAALCKIAARL